MLRLLFGGLVSVMVLSACSQDEYDPAHDYFSFANNDQFVTVHRDETAVKRQTGGRELSGCSLRTTADFIRHNGNLFFRRPGGGFDRFMFPRRGGGWFAALCRWYSSVEETGGRGLGKTNDTLW